LEELPEFLKLLLVVLILSAADDARKAFVMDVVFWIGNGV
jgi:hypothetical protein